MGNYARIKMEAMNETIINYHPNRDKIRLIKDNKEPDGSGQIVVHFDKDFYFNINYSSQDEYKQIMYDLQS